MKWSGALSNTLSSFGYIEDLKLGVKLLIYWGY